MIYYALWNKAKPISSHHGKYHQSRKWKEKKGNATQAQFKHANFLIKYQNQMPLKMSDN